MRGDCEILDVLFLRQQANRCRHQLGGREGLHLREDLAHLSNTCCWSGRANAGTLSASNRVIGITKLFISRFSVVGKISRLAQFAGYTGATKVH